MKENGKFQFKVKKRQRKVLNKSMKTFLFLNFFKLAIFSGQQKNTKSINEARYTYINIYIFFCIFLQFRGLGQNIGII